MTPSVRHWCLASWQECAASQLADRANRHKALPTLGYCLQYHQIWNDVPADVQAMIQQSRQLHGLRQLKIIAQLAEMDVALGNVGAVAILLKGAALLHYQLYPSLGLRVNSDIDILVAADRVSSIVTVFQELGYTFEGNYDPDCHYDHHLPPLVRPQSIHVEIHPLQSGLGNHIHQRMFETAEAIEGFSALKLPVATELFWHMALHARFNSPQLRNLLDLYLLRSLYPIDGELLAHRAQVEGLAPVWSMLMSQLQEFERGEASHQTIQTWEWRPSPKFESIYYRWRISSWTIFFTPVTRSAHPLVAMILFVPALVWRLIRLSGLLGEWLLGSWELSRTGLI